MTKPRLLIPMSIQFSVRYIVRSGLLERLRETAQPVLLLGWRDPELECELKRMGAEVDVLPEGHIGKGYDRVRSWMNFIQKKQLNTPSEGIWERRAALFRKPYKNFRRRTRKQVFHAAFAVPGTISWLYRKERELWKSDTNRGELLAHIDRLKPDAVLSLTPFLRNEEMTVRACGERGIPLCVSVLSFDNITTRGWWPMRFQRHLVWNRYNAEELLRAYPHVEASTVKVVGSPQFDFYWNRSYCWSEEEWRRQTRLPADRPVILFGGGHYFCAPQEPRFLQQIDEAITNQEIPGNPIILFRNHPVDHMDRWLPTLEKAKNVVVDDPRPVGREIGLADMSRRDIQRLASCLYHSRAHVSVSSTMAIDGAIFDRPQIGPAYDDSPGRKFDLSTQELYLHEHFLPITRSGGIEIVRNRDELVRAVREALEHPERQSAGRKRLVREICTYDDGRAAERVAHEVQEFLGHGTAAEKVLAKFA